jgi:hypothetical protein
MVNINSRQKENIIIKSVAHDRATVAKNNININPYVRISDITLYEMISTHKMKL